MTQNEIEQAINQAAIDVNEKGADVYTTIKYVTFLRQMWNIQEFKENE